MVMALHVERHANPVAGYGSCCIHLGWSCSPGELLPEPCDSPRRHTVASVCGAPNDPAGITASGLSASQAGGFGVLWGASSAVGIGRLVDKRAWLYEIK